MSNNADVAINWAGGFHHAKKSEASGFCYINDIVLAILELLKKFERVLYVDIDVHHGDGVEEAFYATNRVMTLSFHKGGNFFPGTGTLEDVGIREGEHFSVNFPLHEGMNDDMLREIFSPTFELALAVFRPSVVVLQCGADSLAKDRLGCFNLTLKGHGSCVERVLACGLPVLVLGGGGYNVRNVARCWAYETSVCAGMELSNDIPFNAHYEKFAPSFKLHIPPSPLENFNTREYLEATREKVFSTLRKAGPPPSVAIEGKHPIGHIKNAGELSHKAKKEGEFMD